MNQPEIRYCKTSDGVNIAYWTMGEGPALFYMPFSPVFSHIQMEWQIPEMRAWYEALAERVTLVRYDCRGMGLSDRAVPELSLDALVRDLEAVVSDLKLDRVALFGHANSAPAAITYAADNPAGVSNLIIWSTAATGGGLPAGSVRTVRVLADKDWKLFTETWAHAAFGWAGGDRARRFAELRRESTSSDVTLAMWSAFDEIDVTDLLDQVTVPTLVMHRRKNPIISIDGIRSLAAGIKDARLVLFEGGEGVPFLGDVDAVLQTIDEFLGLEVPASPTPPADAPLPQGTAIILFADIANSTGLTEELGDAAFREKARALDTALRDAISAAGGTAIEGKLLGDGVLATFNAAREAIACAQACHEAGRGVDLTLHVGIHAGDVIREDAPDGRANVFGGAVNVAARISDASEAGETLVSGTVRDLARTSAGVSFEDKGERDLKGVSDAVRVFAVTHPSAP